MFVIVFFLVCNPWIKAIELLAFHCNIKEVYLKTLVLI
jgi:hypothetical protein